jgi:hypothetical protein
VELSFNHAICILTGFSPCNPQVYSFCSKSMYDVSDQFNIYFLDCCYQKISIIIEKTWCRRKDSTVISFFYFVEEYMHAGREELMLTQVAETFFRQEDDIIRTLKWVKYVVSHKYFSNISSGEIQRKGNLSITCSCHQTTGPQSTLLPCDGHRKISTSTIVLEFGGWKDMDNDCHDSWRRPQRRLSASLRRGVLP